MANTAKKAILRAKVEGALTDLMVKTQADNVFLDDSATVAGKLAEMVTAINLRAKSEDVTAEIAAAINGLVAGAPETYDTLKEIADYIAAHEDVVTALNAAVGAKADKTALDAVKATVDALGSLATKSKVGEAELDAGLKAKIDSASAANHSHANKAALDGITADVVAEWNSKGTVFVQPTQPASLTEGDLWFQTEA